MNQISGEGGWKLENTFQKGKKNIRALLLVLVILFTTVMPQDIYADTSAGTEGTQTVTADILSPDIDTVLKAVREYILNKDKNPDYVSSSWNVIGLTRSGMGVPEEYINTYYTNTVKYLEENNWSLTKTKYSDYSKLIVALTAIGKDARNIKGHNILAYLSDFTNVKIQGFNGPIWALIALKSHPDYTIPVDPTAKEQTTEEGLIQYLLERETSEGGWTLFGSTPDSDITGMTIQALSSYYGKRDDVTAAIDRALTWLSKSQLESGGYATVGTETSESVAQIVVALASIGVDGAKDQRFIKNGKWPMTGLFQYYLPEGGFMHVAAGAGNNGGGEAGKLDGMATEQGFYATVAYKRMLEGKSSLYNMSDVTIQPDEVAEENTTGNTEQETTSTEQETTSTEQETETMTVKVIDVSLDYSTINLKVGKSKTLKAAVTPSNATNGALKWSSSDKKVATVNQKGKVTGKKAGTAKITVTTKDGSELKAVCTVKVTETASAKKAAVKKTQTRKVNLTTSEKKKKSTETETKKEGQATGWSFESEQYVPETSTSAEVVQTEGLNEKELIPGAEPVHYILIGSAGTLAAEALLWLIISLYKKKKNKVEKTAQ